MKIVNLDEFMKLPKGTIYSYYEPNVVNGLLRKDENVNDNDFFEVNLMPGYRWDEDAMGIDNVLCRWGMYDYEAQFLVYEQEDIQLMVDMLLSKEEEDVEIILPLEDK